MGDYKPMSVGAELLNEIERVAAMRQHYKSVQGEMGPAGAGIGITVQIMTMEIEAAKRAIAENDAPECIRSLAALRGYDDND